MGWSSATPRLYANCRVDRKKTMDAQFDFKERNLSVTVLKSAMVGSVWYGAVEVADDEGVRVTAVVAKTMEKTEDYGPTFFYSACAETAGPTETKCPLRILDALDPPGNEWAKEWREKCRANARAPKLKDLPVGTRIRFRIGDETFVATKRAPAAQFKRAWWQTKTDRYVPVGKIPLDFEVVD